MNRPEDLPDGKYIADLIDRLFREGRASTFLNLFSPEQMQTAIEQYQAAFLDTVQSRGLSKNTVDAIEKSDCSAILEAEDDDVDGCIGLPPALEKAIFAPYEGIIMPKGESRPVNVTSIMLGSSVGKIEVEPQLINYTRGPKREGYITVTETGRACCSEIAFDFEKGIYYTDIVVLDERGSMVREEGQDNGIVKKHQMTPQMMADFSALLPQINKREASRISIYKKVMTELPPELDKSNQ